MRISDWSSDVCSSDLNSAAHIGRGEAGACSQMACRTLWRLGELCATCGAADMAALGYARAPPRGGAMADARTVQAQIGRASCRERVCPYVSISVVGVSLKKKNTTKYKTVSLVYT